MKHHKSGTLGEQCAGEEKTNVVEKPQESVEDASNPWNYNIIPPVAVTQEEVIFENKNQEIKDTETVKENKSEEVGEVQDIIKTDSIGEKDVTMIVTDSDIDLKKNGITDTSDPGVQIKEEPLDADVQIKEEPLDGEFPSVFTRRQAYEDGIYKAAPIVLDSDSDEFEPESDESAPSDDDVESHLGLSRRMNYKVKAKKRKKKATLANGTVLYMKNSAGQMVKKHSVQKESTRWVPPHPWVPYRNQVTVEQVCQFLEMHDYPIAVNENLKNKFEDKQVFEDYARPMFEKVNPDAHPLTLMTLIKAKWFEVMNTASEESKEDEMNNEESSGVNELTVEELKEANRNKPVEQRQFITRAMVKTPVLKKIRLNWTL